MADTSAVAVATDFVFSDEGAINLLNIACNQVRTDQLLETLSLINQLFHACKRFSFLGILRLNKVT